MSSCKSSVGCKHCPTQDCLGELYCGHVLRDQSQLHFPLYKTNSSIIYKTMAVFHSVNIIISMLNYVLAYIYNLLNHCVADHVKTILFW